MADPIAACPSCGKQVADVTRGDECWCDLCWDALQELITVVVVGVAFRRGEVPHFIMEGRADG